MISMDFSGFENVQRQLQEAMTALQQLDGEIATLKIDPNDPDAAAKAIREMRAAVDAKVAPYRGNSLVEGLAEKSKEVFADALRRRVVEAGSQA